MTASGYQHPAGARAYFMWDSTPLGGLGLPLAEACRKGIPDRLYTAAIEQALVPPFINSGIEFTPPTSIDHACAFDHVMSGDSDAPDLDFLADHPNLLGIWDVSHFAPYLPLLDLPASRDYLIYQDHLLQLLWAIARGDVSAAGLKAADIWSRPCRQPQPYVYPKAAGPVWPGHLSSFFAGYPELAKSLSARLPWSDAGGWGRCRRTSRTPRRSNSSASKSTFASGAWSRKQT